MRKSLTTDDTKCVDLEDVFFQEIPMEDGLDEVQNKARKLAPYFAKFLAENDFRWYNSRDPTLTYQFKQYCTEHDLCQVDLSDPDLDSLFQEYCLEHDLEEIYSSDMLHSESDTEIEIDSDTMDELRFLHILSRSSNTA